MTDRELLQMALDALEHFENEYGWGMKQKKAYISLQIRLAEPPKDLELPLVRPAEFVKLIQGKENYWGIPVMRTEWPTPEPILPGGGIGRHPDIPTKLFGPNLEGILNAAGFVRQKEWVGLTAKDLVEIPSSCYEGAIWADAKLKEKNT